MYNFLGFSLVSYKICVAIETNLVVVCTDKLLVDISFLGKTEWTYFPCFTYIYNCRLPSILTVHFVNGVRSEDLSSLDFHTENAVYDVCASIIHKNHPNHFTAWIRSKQGILV